MCVELSRVYGNSKHGWVVKEEKKKETQLTGTVTRMSNRGVCAERERNIKTTQHKEVRSYYSSSVPCRTLLNLLTHSKYIYKDIPNVIHKKCFWRFREKDKKNTTLLRLRPF